MTGSWLRRSLMALGCAAVAFAGGPVAAQQFSAEIVSTGGEGSGHSSKIYVSGSKLRIDQGAHEGFMLTDGKAGTSYIVIPQQRMYMEMGAMGGGRMMHVFIPDNPNDACPEWLSLSKSARHGEAESAVATCRRVGSDTVGGRSAIKYEGTTRSGKHVLAWVDPKLRFMLKSQTADGKGMELRNIHEGPQSADLFAIPADFRKMDMKSLMQMRGKMPSQD